MSMQELARLIAEGRAPEGSEDFAGEYSRKALKYDKKDN